MAHKLLITMMVICAVFIGGGFVSGMPSLASDYYPIRPPRPPLLQENFEAGDPLTEEEFHSDISSKTGGNICKITFCSYFNQSGLQKCDCFEMFSKISSISTSPWKSLFNTNLFS